MGGIRRIAVARAKSVSGAQPRLKCAKAFGLKASFHIKRKRAMLLGAPAAKLKRCPAYNIRSAQTSLCCNRKCAPLVASLIATPSICRIATGRLSTLRTLRQSS